MTKLRGSRSKPDMTMYREIIKEGLSFLPMDEIKHPMLWVTDLHLLPLKEWENDLDLELIKIAVELIKPVCIVNTGDTFDTKDETYTSVQQQYEETLEEITAKIIMYHLVGNHDWGKLYSSHALQRYKGMKNMVTVNDNVLRVDHMAFISYIKDRPEFLKKIKEAVGARDLFGHLDINEFQKSLTIEEVHAYADISDLLHFENVFSGHYHLGQDLTIDVNHDKVRKHLESIGMSYASKLPDQTNFTYLGTSRTRSWGEANQTKRLGIIDAATGKFYEVPTGMTFHKTLIMAPGDAFPVLPSDELLRGVEHKVVLQGTKAQTNDMKAAAPAELVGKLSVSVKAEKMDRLVVSVEADMQQSIRDCLYQKIGTDYKVEVTNDNIAQITTDTELDVNKIIEQAVGYAEKARANAG